MKYRIYADTVKSQVRNHEVNEDRYLISEYSFNGDAKIQMLIVADGIGGLEKGENAATTAVKGFLKVFYEKVMELYLNVNMDGFSLAYFADKVEEVIREAICIANEEVCKNSDMLKPIGTTLSVVCIVDRYAIAANVGDSPIYFYKSKSRCLKLVSTLQTQAELDVEAGLYKRYSREYYTKDHILYNSLGQYSKLGDGEVCCCKVGCLEDGDMFLLGSDGAFGRMQNYEILELLEECAEDDEAFILQQLFGMARMDKDDDQTAIFYVVSEEE